MRFNYYFRGEHRLKRFLSLNVRSHKRTTLLRFAGRTDRVGWIYVTCYI